MILFDNTIFKLNFNFKLSYLLIPIIFLLYNYLHNTRKYILYHAVCICIIGIIESFYSYIEKNIGIVTVIVSTIIHLLLLLVLIDFKKNGEINIISLILLFIANLIIIFLPYWPYSIEKKTILILYNTIYFLLYFVYEYIKNYI
jgi:hypothetical protein